MTHYLIEFYFGTCTYKYKITPNKHRIHVVNQPTVKTVATLGFIINGGVKINGGSKYTGGFKDFEKLISGRVGTKYKRKETKIGLRGRSISKF